MKKPAAILLFSSAFLCSPAAMSQIFKCVGHDGGVSFSQAPCPSNQGDASWVGSSTPTPADGPLESSDEIVRRNQRAADIISNADLRREAEMRRAEKQRAEEQALAEANARENQRPKRIRSVCNSIGNTELCRGSDGSRWTTTRNGNYSSTRGRNADGNRFRSSGTTVGGTTFENTQYDD